MNRSPIITLMALLGTGALLIIAPCPGSAAGDNGPAIGCAPPPLNAALTTRMLPADQPFASYWFPNELLAWSPQNDPDAPFNRSHIPLRDRFVIDAWQANDHARPGEGRISPLSVFWATSGNASQGSLDIDYYAFNYWQYTEVLVFWGGSAGEGLILAPNGGIVDAAHRNGVPVLGTIFFPPLAYGGNIQWVWDLVQRLGDNYPVADKLIEVAEYYGFDGYFINQETSGGNAGLASELIDCMKYIQQNSDLQIMWYDAMLENGSIYWQEQLNTSNDGFFHDEDGLVSEHMFLDFGWSASDLQSSRTHARSLGRSEFDLYAGIDVQANGYNTYANWSAVFPEGQPHVTSVGLYVPSWTYHGALDHDDFYQRANRFWVGANRDPGNTQTTHSWKGLAHYIPANSPIDDLPFVTNFGTGQGYDFYVEGVKLSPESWSEQGWNNIALQDILPTWRWIIESDGPLLYPELDWSDAYYGGNCLKLSGDLLTDNHLKLFKTDLAITGDTVLDIAYKTGGVGPSHLQVGLAFTGDPETFTFYEVGAAGNADWNQHSFDLGNHSGQSIAVISLLCTGGAGPDYELKVGRLAVHDGEADPTASPTNLTVTSRVDEEDFVTLRLSWVHSVDEVNYYNVYRRNPDLSLTYLGGTPGEAYFVPEVRRVAGDSLVVIEVEAVSLDFSHSEHATTTFLWWSPPEPATNPAPADGALDVVRNTLLSWTAGQNADSHDVYFGTDSPPEFVANQEATVFDPGDLAANTLYFWRIDERNEVGATPGAEWSFTTGTAFADTAAHALEFDGSNDHVDCGSGAALRITGNQITLEARIMASSWRDNVWEGCILNKEQNGAGNDKGYMLRAGDQGRLNCNLGSGSWHEITSPAGSMATDTWYHVAGSYDGADLRIYIDGEEVGHLAQSFSIADAVDADLWIGNAQNNASRVFAGAIDELRVWNVARDQAQIRQMMNRELPPVYYSSPDSGLVGYWRLNEGTGQIALDLTTAANHGTLGSSGQEDINDPLWTSVEWVMTAAEPGLADNALPLRPALRQNFPNPFNPSTTISYDLPRSSQVSLKVYDLLGREVRTLVAGPQPAGPQNVSWDGRDDRGRQLGSGLYLYRIQTPRWVAQQKMILVK